MAKKPNKQKPVIDEAELKKQAEAEKLAALKKQEEERKLAEEKEKIDKEKNSLLGSIVEQAEALTPEQQKAKNPEQESLKIHLIGGGTTSIREEKEIIAKDRQPYIAHFAYDKGYYKEIFRLNSWDESRHKKFNKPREVAIWTILLIYGRFMKDLPTIMDELRAKNKYVGYCIRRYKFSQYLTPEARQRLDEYIDDCVSMMKGYDNWESFERDYCKKYDLPYQLRLF